MTTPNLADLRARVARANDEAFSGSLAVDMETLCAALDLVDAQAKAIADVLALADHWDKLADEMDAKPWTGEQSIDWANARSIDTLRGVTFGLREAITPDAPASEATGRPLRSSSTEQEDWDVSEQTGAYLIQPKPPEVDPHADPEYRRTHGRDGYALGSAQYPNSREGRRALARSWKRAQR